MHIFYTPDITGSPYTLSPEESRHCTKVLRLENGSEIVLVDGNGCRYEGVISKASPKGCIVTIVETLPDWESRKYRMNIAIAPTKNMERMEWMIEKCTEMGNDSITMLDCQYSERHSVKLERMERIAVSAMKQSLKAYLPKLQEMVSFEDFVRNCDCPKKFIAHCHPGTKHRLEEVYDEGEDCVIMIGPEGDFSEREVELASQYGFMPITLGNSRLRTETAALAACHSIHFINKD